MLLCDILVVEVKVDQFFIGIAAVQSRAELVGKCVSVGCDGRGLNLTGDTKTRQIIAKGLGVWSDQEAGIRGRDEGPPDIGGKLRAESRNRRIGENDSVVVNAESVAFSTAVRPVNTQEGILANVADVCGSLISCVKSPGNSVVIKLEGS